MAKTPDEMIEKRKALMKTYLTENPDVIKKWEQLKEDYEVAKFRKKYRDMNDIFAEDPQLSLFNKE